MSTASTGDVGQLRVSCEQQVATLTIDRPEKLNALKATFWAELRQALTQLASEGDVRVAIITGSGRAFSSGGDIEGFTDLKSPQQIHDYQVDAMAAFALIESSPFIVVAAVNGLALGGGCELALASDIVMAADTATFAFPETALGLVPGFGVIRAAEVVGRQAAKLLIASGDTLDAVRAREMGLVQIVTPADQLLPEARALAARIARRSPLALRAAKRMINRTIDPQALSYSVRELLALHASEDRVEGIAAFRERRPPAFGRPRRDAP